MARTPVWRRPAAGCGEGFARSDSQGGPAMSDEAQDPLWPYFVPLWTDLRKIAPGLLLAGGYGLFLKQQWLVSQVRFLGTESGDSVVTERGEKLEVGEVRTLVAIHRWK